MDTLVQTRLIQNNNNLQYASSSVTSHHNACSPNSDIGESKTNLIINYLPQTMSQEEVRSLFASIGEIESCKLVRDKMTGQSLGYGFVNYLREEDALKAVASFNGLRLQNKTIKVSYARPSHDLIKGANLYVSGLPKSMTPKEMESIFRPFGQIITSRILSDNVTGVGFVRFDKKTEAEVAIQVSQIAAASNLVPLALLNQAAAVRRIGPIHHAATAGRFRYSPLAGVAPAAAPTQDLLTASTLMQLAAVSQAYSVPGVTATAFPGLGAAVPAALAAPAATVDLSTTNAGFCLFVYNLGPDIEDSVLWQLFGPFGAVASVKIIRDFATGKCKGYGFVTMSAYEDAVSAIAALNGSSLQGRTLQVSFKNANGETSLVKYS